MGSQPTLRIPIVDLTDGDLKTPASHAWAAARAQVRVALDFYGCFEAVYNGVTPVLREAVFRAMKELFALPVESKARNVSNKVYNGYIGHVPGLPYESVAVDDVLDPTAARGFTNLMWPQGNPSFCETVCSFAEKATELDRMVRRMVLESMGVDKFYDSHIASTKYKLRLSEYTPPAPGPEVEAEGKVILGPHVDPNMSTLICQNQVHGLEVQARTGDWVPWAPSSPNAFIFLFGDAFRAWSNDRLFSAPHRVRVGDGETRHSVLLFAVPKDEAVIEAPGKLVDEGRPPRFRPYRYGDYVEFFSSAVRKAAASGGAGGLTSILTAFCAAGEGEERVQP